MRVRHGACDDRHRRGTAAHSKRTHRVIARERRMGPDGLLSFVLLIVPASVGLVLAMLMPQMPHEAPAGLGVTIATLYGFGFVLFTVARISDQRGGVPSPVDPQRM